MSKKHLIEAMYNTGDFLNEYDDESFVWITDLFFYLKGLDELDIKDFFVNANTLENVRINLVHLIQNELKIDSYHQENFIKNSRQDYISSEHLRVFRSNDRLAWFAIHAIMEVIQFEIRRQENFRIRIHDLTFSDPYLYFLYLVHIYTHHISFAIKSEDLIEITQQFNKIVSESNNLNKYINDDDFVEWAFNYLTNDTTIYKFKSKILIQSAIVSTKNKRDYILALFDYMHFFDSIEKTYYTLTINRLKKAWQQKSFRKKGGTKSPYHLPLTKTAKQQLKNLAAFKHMTEGELLAKLINQAYLSEMCDSNGKSIY